MTNAIRWVVLLALPIVLARCGTEEDAKKSTPSTSSSSTPKDTCEKPSHSLSGCCSKHGGGKSCGDGMYSFSSGGKLICSDGTTSDTCSK